MLTYARLMAGYRDAAEKNVLAAEHPDVFPGYFSVTADAVDFGHNNLYPALDGHQLTDALLLLGRVWYIEAAVARALPRRERTCGHA